LADGFQSAISNLCSLNIFNSTLISTCFFLFCPDLIEAVGPYQNAPDLPKYFLFYPSLNDVFN